MSNINCSAWFSVDAMYLLPGQQQYNVFVFTTDPDDYVFTQRTLNFMSPLSVSHVVRVFITDDVLDDDGESFTLSLSVPMAEQDTVQLAPRTTVVTIIDDDGG